MEKMDVLSKAKKDGAKIYLKTAGISIMSGQRDLDAFENEITSNEVILCVATGKLAQLSNDRFRGIGFGAGNRQATGTDTKGVLVVTDQQAVFMDKRIFGKQTTVIEGSNISSVSKSNGIISSRILIRSFGTQYDITDLKKEAAMDLLNAINKLKKLSKSNNNTIINKETSGMEEIKKAKKLLDDKIISQKEFDLIKKKHI